MALTRICELPELRYTETQDSDIMVIENFVDTYKITLSDLKTLFGSDAKLEAIFDELSRRIDEVTGVLEDMISKSDTESDSIALSISQLTESIKRNTQNINTLNNQVANIETQLSSVNDTLVKLVTAVDDINDAVDSNHADIVDIKARLDQHDSDISDLQADNAKNKNDITQIQIDLDALKQAIDDMNAVSADTVDNIKKEIMKEVTDRYQELMDIMDENFHQRPLLV